MNWGKLFVYDESSPSYLVNLVDRLPRAKAGTAAGYQRKDGYWLVGHNYKNVLVHRIIYELEHGPIPAGWEIDHKDGNPANNCKNNLRAVPKKVNQRNMKKSKVNKSGAVGVVLVVVNRPKRIYEYWTACWEDVDGNSVRKNFSIEKYGNEEAKRLAELERNAAIEKLNAIGAGYTERHGERKICLMQN